MTGITFPASNPSSKVMALFTALGASFLWLCRRILIEINQSNPLRERLAMGVMDLEKKNDAVGPQWATLVGDLKLRIAATTRSLDLEKQKSRQLEVDRFHLNAELTELRVRTHTLEGELALEQELRQAQEKEMGGRRKVVTEVRCLSVGERMRVDG